jgi:hypothetical protein
MAARGHLASGPITGRQVGNGIGQPTFRRPAPTQMRRFQPFMRQRPFGLSLLSRQSRPSLTRHPGGSCDDCDLTWSVGSPLFAKTWTGYLKL